MKKTSLLLTLIAGTLLIAGCGPIVEGTWDDGAPTPVYSGGSDTWSTSSTTVNTYSNGGRRHHHHPHWPNRNNGFNVSGGQPKPSNNGFNVSGGQPKPSNNGFNVSGGDAASVSRSINNDINQAQKKMEDDNRRAMQGFNVSGGH